MSTGIRRIIILSVVAALATFSGCGGGGSSSDSGTPLPARTLSWDPPTSYVDTTAMNPVTDLDRFEIYVKESGSFTDADSPMAAVSAVNKSTNNLTTSFNLANIGPPLSVGPQYYVSLRAVALTGLKSDFSPPVSFSF
ncbi:MAG: hypothetical protein WBM29_02430 [Candidatus Deferrimicrobium sp.]